MSHIGEHAIPEMYAANLDLDPQDLTGQRFCRLVVQALSDASSASSGKYWECLCDCGIWHVVRGYDILSGKTKSCGCLRDDNNRARSGERHHYWRGEMATERAKRDRARRRYNLGDCERCGEPATERHHKDGDTGNNEPSNIDRLCRRCHMIVDGRLERFIALSKHPRKQPPKPCVVCGKPSKPLRRGRCSRCADYFRRYAKDRTGLPALPVDTGACS